MQVDHMKRRKKLEEENARVRKATSELTLDRMILQEEVEGNS